MSSLSKLTNANTTKNIKLGDSIYVLAGDSTTTGGNTPETLGGFVRSNTALSRTTYNSLSDLIGTNKSPFPINSTSYTTVTTGFGTSDIRRCIYENGIYVIAGAGGKIATSTDALTWTIRTSGTTTNIWAMTYGGSNPIYVVAGEAGILLTSTDAITWTAQTSGTSSVIYGLAYGNGRYVAVGSGGMIRYSSDAITWSTATNKTSTTINILDVAYGNGRFVYAGEQTNIGASLDGVAWGDLPIYSANLSTYKYFNGKYYAGIGGGGSTSGAFLINLPSGTGEKLNKYAAVGGSVTDICYGYDRYVAVGERGLLSLSLDGTYWDLDSSGYENILALIYANGLFVSASSTIRTSTNGIFWNTRQRPDPSYTIKALAYGNSIFVSAGEVGSVLTSTDAITWTARTSGTAINLNCLTYGNGLFVAGGNSGKILTSTDGITWTDRTSGTTTYISSITYHNGKYYYAGGFGTDCRIATSTDAITWTASNLTTTPNINEKLGVSIGRNVDGTNYIYVASKQGTISATWESSNEGVSFNKGVGFSNITENNGFFIDSYGNLKAVGIGTFLTNGYIAGRQGLPSVLPGLYSGLGIFSGTLRCVAYGSGIYVALGDRAILYTSTDGVSWGLSGTLSSILSVTYGNNIYVYAGVGGVLATSTDAITWTQQWSGTSQDIRKITYVNGIFLYGGNNGILATSTDAITWTTRNSNMPTVNPITDIQYGNGIYIYAASGVATSTDAITWVWRYASTKSNGGVYKLAYGINVGWIGTPSGGGTVQFSSDGIGWTSYSNSVVDFSPGWATYSPDEGFTLAGAPTVFTSGSGVAITQSKDGITWLNCRTNNSYYNIYNVNGMSNFGVSFSNGSFLVTGQQGFVATSTNGWSWTPFTGTNITLYRSAYGAGVYAACSLDGTRMFTSYNLKNWNYSVISNPAGIFGILHANNKWILWGPGGAFKISYDVSQNIEFALSTNLKVTNNPLYPLSNWTSVTGTYLKKYIKYTTNNYSNLPIGSLIIDYNSSSTLNNSPEYIKALDTVVSQAQFPELYAQLGKLYTTTWQPITSAASFTNAVIYANGIFVAASNFGDIRTSTDAITWTSRTSGTSSSLFGLAYVNSLFIYAGAGGVLRTSTDAITWTARTSGTTSTLRTITYGNLLYVYGGNGGVLATSTDAITWTAQTSGTTSTINALVYGNSLYVIAGAGGMLRTSTDAITWTAQTSGTTSTINTLIYANSLYIIAGVGGMLSTSTDAITWTTRTSGVVQTINTLIYANGVYVFGTNFELTSKSTDAITWSAISNVINSTSSILSITYGNGIYLYGGNAANFMATSTDLTTRRSALYNVDTSFIVPKIVTNNFSGNQVYIKAKP